MANNNEESHTIDLIQSTIEKIARERPDYTKDLNEAMLAALFTSPLENLKVVQRGVDFRAKNTFNISVMHFAAVNQTCSTELVVMYSLLGLDPFEPDDFGETPIDSALEVGRIETAEQLLKMHNAGCTLLHYCIVLDEPKFLGKVLRYNCDKNKNLIYQHDFQGRNAFHVAAQFADRDCFVTFLREIKEWHSQSVEACEEYFNSVCRDRGCSAYHYAVLNKKHGVTIISLLRTILNLDQSLKDRKGYTPFHVAMITENLDAADELRRCSASTNEKIRGKSIMAVCVLLKKFKSVKYLHEMNDDNRIFRVRVDGYNAFHYALHTVDLETCKWLAEEVGFLKFELLRNNFPKGSRGNALHFSACNVTHGADLVKYFADKGVDLNLEDKDGITPLHAAIKSDNAAVAEILIRAGADLEVAYEGDNYFLRCVRLGALACAKVLLKERKDLMESRNLLNGESVLQIAAKGPTEEMARWLVEVGTKTHDGKSVEDLIQKN